MVVTVGLATGDWWAGTCYYSTAITSLLLTVLQSSHSHLKISSLGVLVSVSRLVSKCKTEIFEGKVSGVDPVGCMLYRGADMKDWLQC